MIRSAALLAMATLALAGCSKPAGDQSRAKPTSAPLVKGGWPAVWNDAARTVELLGNIGFRPGPYHATQAGYRADAAPTPMGDPSITPVNTANLAITGSIRQLDALRFSLDVVNDRGGAFARQQFARWIGQALGQLGVDGGRPVGAALDSEQPGKGGVTGATYSITRDPIPGGRRWVVTFSRPDAKAGTANLRNA